MQCASVVTMLLMTPIFVQTESKNEVGKLYLSLNYRNPKEELIDGEVCDYGESCDVYFLICVRRAGSKHCDMYNETTTVYMDTNEISATEMSAIVFPLTSPVSKIVEILIEVWDFDKLSSSDIIGHFKGILNMETLSENATVVPMFRRDLIYNNSVELQAVVRLQCVGPRGDNQCNIICSPREGINTCDKKGNFICEKGLTGPTCDQIDRCVENNCAVYATCQTLEDGYKCVCRGKEGTVCEKGYDPCLENSVCGAHGRCVADGPDYFCECDLGWGGRHCNQEVKSCEQATQLLGQMPVCLNGGICRNGNESNYYCQCPHLWTGPRCEIFNICAIEDCSGHGTCMPSKSQRSGFECKCNKGWSGPQCSNKTSTPCQIAGQRLLTNTSMVCLHGGVCVDHSNGVDFSCICLSGWSGKRCEVFFTQTMNFILPMIFSPILLVVGILTSIRKRLRRRHLIKPLTYGTRPFTMGGEAPNYSDLAPYTINGRAESDKGVYESCVSPYYVGPVRHQEIIPASMRLGLRNVSTTEYEGSEDSDYSLPVLPPRNPACPKLNNNTKSSKSYVNTQNNDEAQYSHSL
uniref:Delta-like protein n=3 Tax=Mesocestoides corti TaxID=53468 RepID=A0A5K3F864_MESCO